MSSAVPALEFGAMTEVIRFLMEIDKLKSVQRRTKVLGTQRQENSAEHSWHFAIAAMSLAPYAGKDVDIQRVIQMALLHDIVEIDRRRRAGVRPGGPRRRARSGSRRRAPPVRHAAEATARVFHRFMAGI
ncbi:Uncharacterised protein [Serratia rubidaea]|uniref:HD domain-containing protein n=1 Tax=Serratia rubidaea TaxID=61652 RepID=A0A3S4FQZ0_SERRU|nr:Uncharacterised protein [Serratia rubidaea]